MKNLTLALDEQLLDKVRVIAAERKTTVNALVRDYLGRIASEESRLVETRAALRELMETSDARLGPGYVWNREEIYEERMFPRHEHSRLRGDSERGLSEQVRDRSAPDID